MATKRTRQSRKSELRITDEILDLYRRGLPLNAFNIQCIESDEMCAHSECDEYHEISLALQHQLHLAAWLPSIFGDGQNCEPPQSSFDAGWEIVGPIKAAMDKALASDKQRKR